MWKQCTKWRWGSATVTNVALCLLGYGLLMMARQFVSETDHFTFGFDHVSAMSALLYVGAVVIVLTQPVDRKTIWIVLGFAVAQQAMTLFEDPFLSTDIYRYVWDGVVQHAHINPYRYVPGNAALTFLRAPNQDVFNNINRRDYARTIYPPAAQMVFWLATFFEPTVQGMKAAMFAFECGTCAALIVMLRWMRRPISEVLLFAWCPLLVWEIAGSGHIDAAVFFFVAIALLFRFREKPVLVGLFLGLAVMTKFYPLVLLPALWRRGDWKMPAVVASVCAVGYAMYSSVGLLVFGFFKGYEKEEGMNSGARYFLLDWLQRHTQVAGKNGYLVFCALVLGGISLWCWRYATVEDGAVDRVVDDRPQSAFVPNFVKGSVMLATAMMLLFSPHYAWYLAWLIPLMALWPNWVTVVYVCAFFYGYTTKWADGTPDHSFFLNAWIYVVVALAAIVGWLWSRYRVDRTLSCRDRRRSSL
jgi:alpha-1,6-mannosyltransferase